MLFGTNLSAIVLAAGFSRRFGKENKLLVKLNGAPVLAYTLDNVAAFPFSQRIVVVNDRMNEEARLCDRCFDVIENENAQAGIGSSIAMAAQALINTEAVMVFLGDMPILRRETIAGLISAIETNSGASVVAPVYNGSRGHPVIFSAKHFSALASLTGDHGARDIINSNADSLMLMNTNDPGVLTDDDYPSDIPS